MGYDDYNEWIKEKHAERMREWRLEKRILEEDRAEYQRFLEIFALACMDQFRLEKEIFGADLHFHDTTIAQRQQSHRYYHQLMGRAIELEGEARPSLEEIFPEIRFYTAEPWSQRPIGLVPRQGWFDREDITSPHYQSPAMKWLEIEKTNPKRFKRFQDRTKAAVERNNWNWMAKKVRSPSPH